MVTDITERKRSEEALVRREGQLAEAQRLAQLGSWEFDLTTERFSWSAEHYRMFGVDPQVGPLTGAVVSAPIHPEDLESIRANFAASLSSGEPFESEFPVGDLVLVLDNVITHDAKLVRAWLARSEHARIRLLWLPKYSAHERNPIERIWGLLKDHVAANRLYGSIDLLVAQAERYRAETPFRAPNPVVATVVSAPTAMAPTPVAA